MRDTLKKLVTGVTFSALAITQTVWAGPQEPQKQPKTMKQMVTTCAAVTVGSALLAGLLSHGDKKKAAIGGAAVGAVACTAVMAFNNKADKKRIAEAEARAAETGEAQQDAWNDQNQHKAMTTRVIGEDQSIALADNSPTICRVVETSLTANNSSADPIQQIYCRAPDGSWKTKESLGIA